MKTKTIIAFLSKIEKDWLAYIKALKREFPKVTFSSLIDSERIELIKTADAVISGRLTAEEVTNAKKLKVIFVPFTGLNNFPVEQIKKRGIIISNTHANAPYVAEHAVAMALTLLGNIIPSHADLKQGKWNRNNEHELWKSIRNRAVGIIGFGHIGANIAKLLEPFGCSIYGFKKELTDDFPVNYNLSTDLNRVIKKSDIIFVCLPLNPETRNIINAEILAEMKGKYIINVGRGETISEEALYNTLKNGILIGAALDVWYNYPKNNPEPVYPAHFPFWDLPNVLLSPHKSSQTDAAIDAMIKDTYENIRSYLINGIPKQIAQI